MACGFRPLKDGEIKELWEMYRDLKILLPEEEWPEALRDPDIGKPPNDGIEALPVFEDDPEVSQTDGTQTHGNSSDPSKKPEASHRRTDSSEASVKSFKSAYESHPQLGRLASPDDQFCPVMAVAKYPYKFVHKHLQEKIAQKFFNNGQFWDREWDIYYIWAEHTSPPKPVFFIRTEEVDALLNEINNAFEDCSLCLGVEAQEFGLVCSFPNHPDLRPRYLGHCCSREQYLSLERHISDSDFRPDGEPESIDPVDDSVMANFKLKLDMAIDVARGKSRAGKVVRQKQRTENRQKWKSELKDAERMLGLRPAHVAAPELDPDESWTEQKARYASLEESKSYVGASSPPRQSIQDDHGLPPYPFDGQPILVSLDIECHEYDKSKITEVGIGILDTNDIVGVAPRNNGKGWHKYIEAYHFRIKEYMHLCNVEYVAGCPDRFEFGHSIVCPASDAVDLITTLFQSCYAGDIPESCDLDTHDAPLHPTSPRRIILIGHDVTQDIRYLTRLGLPLKSIPTKEVIDTADLYKALHREWNHKGLSTLMHDYGFVAWNMHNAGNDAVYTLWVCFALTLRGAQDCGSEVVRNAFQSKKMKAMQEAIDSAYEKVLEDHEGWSDEEDAVVGMDGTSGDVSRRSSGSKKPKVVWESDKE